MAEYKSDEIALQGSAECVYGKLSNLEALRTLLDKVPEDQIPQEQKKMFEEIRITPETITIPAGAGPIGEFTLRKEGCIEPNLVRLVGEGLPVALALMLEIKPVSDSESLGRVVVDMDVPMLLKPMISGPINKLIAQIAGFLPALKFSEE
ncbi:MAG: hypothetical protein HDS74_08605 [Bacteroidales bacterium]|nr:hypothetical protein [Bacteroidales bacterium]MBD5213129.1 hypothetical protein [Bacteroidales bacterium]MBD5217562.1 hypothetical protein [Bacteroidales bacterium]